MVLRAWADDRPAPIGQVTTALARVRGDAASVTDRDWVALLGARGDELDELCALADAARATATVPDVLTFVVNRNLDTAVVARRAADPSLEDLVAEAAAIGATEICMQGPVPDDAPADEYLRLVARIHGVAPELHVHAFRPPEVRDAAARMRITLSEFLIRARDAGLGSVPGTAAQILDDEVRSALHPTGTPAPVSDWVDTIESAHRAGLFSTATMLYGHVETPEQQVAHLRLLCAIQARTGGFSELILMPMLPGIAPPHLADAATHRVSRRETRAVHAVARLLTLGRFNHLQAAWPKLDAEEVTDVLRGGADDIGGLLLDGRLSPESGQEAGRTLGVEQLVAIADSVGRTPRQRTTRYETLPAERCIPLPDSDVAGAQR